MHAVDKHAMFGEHGCCEICVGCAGEPPLMQSSGVHSGLPLLDAFLPLPLSRVHLWWAWNPLAFTRQLEASGSGCVPGVAAILAQFSRPGGGVAVCGNKQLVWGR